MPDVDALKRLVERSPKPNGVELLDLSCGNDSSNEPSLWVTFLVDEGVANSNEDVKALNAYRHYVISELLKAAPETWPYIEFKAKRSGELPRRSARTS